MELLIELMPYIGSVIGILIVALLAKWGININKQITINGTITVLQKLMEIFGWVEEDSTGKYFGEEKLNKAVELAKLKLNDNELKMLKNIGDKAEKHPDKATFGDNIKAGVQDIFLNSVSMLAKDQMGKLIKKM